jgi:branched-chain amino acid aminotransferase
MDNFINYNGKIVDAGKSIINRLDHSYRYGDGLFETMKVKDASIVYAEYHFDRLFAGFKNLKITIPPLFTKQKIMEETRRLCEKNNCSDLARIRLSVSRGNGGLYDCDDQLSYLIECLPLEKELNLLNENGLVIDIFPGARKSIDIFSNLKSANYLPYVMAAVWAIENKLNDALVLNSHDRICDATIANVFWAKDAKIFTPPLSEGGVAGVMRRRILETDHNVSQSLLTEDILLNADEVFLTNVITGIRWVKQFRNKTYTNAIANKLFADLIQTN